MACRLPYSLLLKEEQSKNFNNKANNIKVALLGDCAVQQFTPLLQALFRQVKFEADIFVSLMDGPELKALHPESALFGFKPDLIVVLNTVQSLRDQYYRHGGVPAEFLSDHRSRITRVWGYIKENADALVIQSNFADPIEQIYERSSLQLSSSLPRIVTRLNGFISLQIENRDRIRLLDIHELASVSGLHQWFDEGFWAISKAFCALEFQPLVASRIVDIFISAQEPNQECVNLDQNEYWGGIIQEDSCHTEREDFFSQNYLQLLSKLNYIIER